MSVYKESNQWVCAECEGRYITKLDALSCCGEASLTGKQADNKVKSYLERADEIRHNFTPLKPATATIIEIAKMIQLEEK